MCFSSEVSLITFIIGIIGSYLCIQLGEVTDKIVGYLFGFIALMQLIEYLLWNHQKCDNYNKLLSISGMLLNHLQPVVLGFLVLFFNKNMKNRWIIYLILFIYLMVIIPYSLQFLRSGKFDCTLKSKKKSHHLIWKWNRLNGSKWAYILFTLSLALIAIFGLPDLKYGIIMSITIIFSFVTSFIIYPSEAIGALWCFYSVFIVIIYYLLRITKIFNF
jgi:hypothetical protein